jgi:hypothetical protein
VHLPTPVKTTVGWIANRSACNWYYRCSFQDLLCGKCFWVQVESKSSARVPSGELLLPVLSVVPNQNLVKSMVDVEESLAYWDG